MSLESGLVMQVEDVFPDIVDSKGGYIGGVEMLLHELGKWPQHVSIPGNRFWALTLGTITQLEIADQLTDVMSLSLCW